MNRLSLGVGLAFALAACVPMPVNPERKACNDACVQEKNRCLLAAGDAVAVEQCDADQRACAQPCLAMPAYAPAVR